METDKYNTYLQKWQEKRTIQLPTNKPMFGAVQSSRIHRQRRSDPPPDRERTFIPEPAWISARQIVLYELITVTYLNEVTMALDDGVPYDVIMIDFRRAFDLVPFSI